MKRSKRIEGPISALKSAHYPHSFLFFDTETHIIEHNNGFTEFPLKLGVAIYVLLDKDLAIKARETHYFKTQEEFITLLETHNRKKNTLVVMAHNIAFDIQVLDLPALLHREGYSSEPPIIKERAFIWSVKSEHGTYKFLDTSNFGVISVSQLGNDLGFSKLDIDFDTATDDQLFTYCQRDTEILERFILDYVHYLSEHDLGTFKDTLASQSLATYRTRFITNPPYIHNDLDVIKLERDSYHGGRVECFFIGNAPKQDYYYLDVNSMYPYAMYQEELPLKLTRHTYKCPVWYLKLRLQQFYCIAKVKLKTDLPAYPLIYGHKLIFPIGEFEVTLCHDELAYAFEHGHITEVLECACYTKGAIFKRYVDFFYDAKKAYSQEGKAAYRYISKMFLNSLYGKFGQLEVIREVLGTDKYIGITRIPGMIAGTGQSFDEVSWFGTVYGETRGGETALSFPALAAAITSKARMRLWYLIELAGLDNVFYVDTDSLITNKDGYARLKDYLDNQELGYLKLEKTSEELAIFGCKDYRFGKDEKTKGVPTKAKRLSDNSWTYMQFHGFRTWLNDGGNHPPRAHHITKFRRASYNKGKVNPDGTVKPLTFPLGYAPV